MGVVEQRRCGAVGVRDAASLVVALVLILPLCLAVVVAATALLVPVMPGGDSELIGPVPAALLSTGSSLGVWLCWRRLVAAVSGAAPVGDQVDGAGVEVPRSPARHPPVPDPRTPVPEQRSGRPAPPRGGVPGAAGRPGSGGLGGAVETVRG